MRRRRPSRPGHRGRTRLTAVARRRRRLTTVAWMVSLAAPIALPAPARAAVAPAATSSPSAGTVTVGSKNFDESRILAEMFARLIEDQTDLTVERKPGLAGTQICFDALRTGAIDLYPEYTGTGLVTILDEPPGRGATETLNLVRSEFRSRWNLIWLAPLGFENAYELAVPGELARRENLRTISDLARVSQSLTAGFGYEFITRDDGLPGLEARYGLRFRDVKSMQQALKYEAAGARRIDCLDVYTTDGRLVAHDLVVLEDDLGFFPPYEAAALVRGATLARHPELGTAIALLAGALNEESMRRLNHRVDTEGEAIEVVAQDALEQLGLVGRSDVHAVTSRDRNLLTYMRDARAYLLTRTLEHIVLAGLGLALAAMVAVPLGLVLERRRGQAEHVIRGVGMTQTIPSLALLAFMIPFFGIGAIPAVVALWIYAIFPILRNTFTGVRDASPQAVEAATALGMTAGQVLFRVRLPLAAPVIMAGVRTAAVITVGTATLAAFIGAGGLGEPIIAGLQTNDRIVILSGAIPAALLALVVDGLLGLIERVLRPRGIGSQR